MGRKDGLHSEGGSFNESLYLTKARRRVSSVVEHSSANPKVPGSIPCPVSCRDHGL